MDLSLLLGDLPQSDEPGLKTLDPRLGDVADLVQEGQFNEASEAVAELLREGICDIRLVGYLAIGPFLARGPAAMGEIADAFDGALDKNWDAFGPLKKKEKQAAQSLVWFGKNAVKRLQREEGNQEGATWSEWTHSMTQEEVDTAVSALRRLQGVADEKLGDAAGPVLEVYSNVRQWMEGFRNAVYVPPPEPEPEPEPEEETPQEEAQSNAGSNQGAAMGIGFGPAVTVQGSPYLHDLMRKLEGFTRLVEKGEFKRALIIADDVQEVLQQFDPRLYFPHFFKTFAKMNALHANELIEWEHERESPEWNALRNLYLVDIDEFVDLEK